MIGQANGSQRPVSEQHRSDCDQRARVLIADHDGLARRMLHNALQETGGITMLPAAGNAREALELARYYHPTALIIDTALPPAGCVELIGEVQQVAHQTRILTVSAGVSADEDEIALAALRAGAVGHLTKDADPGYLARLVTRALAEGEAIVPQRLVMPLLGMLHEVPDTGWRPLHSRLTTREWQIVELLGDGATTERIAEQLVLSATTVYSHVKSIMRKLGVHSRREVITAARRLRREEVVGTKPPSQLG
jgi:DNA-binding NarL/FixJ family response regulator